MFHLQDSIFFFNRQFSKFVGFFLSFIVPTAQIHPFVHQFPQRNTSQLSNGQNEFTDCDSFLSNTIYCKTLQYNKTIQSVPWRLLYLTMSYCTCKKYIYVKKREIYSSFFLIRMCLCRRKSSLKITPQMFMSYCTTDKKVILIVAVTEALLCLWQFIMFHMCYLKCILYYEDA